MPQMLHFSAYQISTSSSFTFNLYIAQTCFFNGCACILFLCLRLSPHRFQIHAPASLPSKLTVMCLPQTKLYRNLLKAK
jgi:hypothetical protein